MSTYGPREMKKHVCACGETFEAAGSNVKYCPACRDFVMHARGRLRWLGESGGNIAIAVAAEYEKYLQALRDGTVTKYTEQRLAKRRRKRKPVQLHPCRYCGKPTRGPYCRTCVSAGLHWVNQVTGRTNGWDRKGVVK